MNVTIPEDLANALNQRAQERQVGLEALVRQALRWYLCMDESLLDELQAWQEVRDEALDRVEKELE